MNEWYQSSYQRLLLKRANKYYYVFDGKIRSEAVTLVQHKLDLYKVDPKEDITKYEHYESLHQLALKLDSILYQELIK